jgi:hypothetical protein
MTPGFGIFALATAFYSAILHAETTAGDDCYIDFAGQSPRLLLADRPPR